MIPFILKTPREIAATLAARVKALRLDRGWTQSELAARAGIALPTYRVFERTGKISVERLLKVAEVLDAQDGFDRLFTPPEVTSIAELKRRAEQPLRKRGVRRSRTP
jgi:HTH-type transcriptional regulator / antitoxin HipB